MSEVTVTERAIEVLRKGFETARLDASAYGVRLRIAGGAARSAFAEEPEPGDTVVDAGGIRLFLDGSITARGSVTVDVSAEHEQIVLV